MGYFRRCPRRLSGLTTGSVVAQVDTCAMAAGPAFSVDVGWQHTRNAKRDSSLSYARCYEKKKSYNENGHYDEGDVRGQELHSSTRSKSGPLDKS